MRKSPILLVDDDPEFLEALSEFLHDTGALRILTADNATGALKRVQENPEIECIVLDYHLPDYDGLQVSDLLRRETPHIPIILVSQRRPGQWIEEQARARRMSYATKRPLDILAAIRKNVKFEEAYEIDREMQEWLKHSKLVCESPGMAQVLHDVSTAARSDLNVLLLGEPGTGKTEFARGIHRLSRRRNMPWEEFDVALFSQASDAQFFKDQLFGHKKNAWTGAQSDKIGLVELAQKGTLFLDEIGSIPLEAQSALLSAAERKRYRREGDPHDRVMDVRLIFATNKMINKPSEQQDFRMDLYERINHELIIIPPLRERPEDIRPIVEMLLQQFATQAKGRVLDIDPDVFSYLEGLPWPGNVRQLQNVIVRAVHHLRSDTIHVADITPEVYKTIKEPLKPLVLAPPDRDSSEDRGNEEHKQEVIPTEGELIEKFAEDVFSFGYVGQLKDMIDKVRKALIIMSLERTSGKVGTAEKELWGYSGRSNGALRRWILKYKIDLDRFKWKV